MGGDASTRTEPTGEELARMQATIREALDAGAIGFASSFSPNHSGFAGLPMPSTIASDAELRALVGTLGEAGRGVFMMATGPRATPEFMESLVEETGRPAFISTVLTMYWRPSRSAADLLRAVRGRYTRPRVYIQTTCQPLSFDFTLRDPYLPSRTTRLDRVKTARPALGAIYADPAFRSRFRNLARPQAGISSTATGGVQWRGTGTVAAEGGVAALAREAGKDPLDFFFDFALANISTLAFGKLFQNRDGRRAAAAASAGRHSLSDAGAHLIFMRCRVRPVLPENGCARPGRTRRRASGG